MPSPRPIVRLLASGLLLSVLGAGCGLSGSSSRPSIRANVPVQESAAEQFRYAEDYRVSRNLDLLVDEQKFANAREAVRQTYLKVEEYFPEDRMFTPLALLTVAEMEAGLDAVRVDAQAAQRRRAIEMIQDLIDRYPEHEFIQAKGRYDIGLLMKQNGEFAEAQIYFNEVCEGWRNSAKESLKNLSERACWYYNRTYIEEE